MKTNERFLDALKYMNSTMKNDNSLGHQWRYCNVTSKKAKGFEEARTKGKYLINCVDGVQWALKIAGIPSSALCWYGTDGRIAWTKTGAKEAAQKYFSIISTQGKTVKQLYDSGQLCDGDILIGYQGMNHTNCYYGGSKSFDSGHAYCSGSGEEARFKKWIGSLAHKTKKVNWILRLKDRAHYRVQAGAFSDFDKYNEQAALMRKKGFAATMILEDGMYKVQAGYYSGKTNAEKMVAALAKKGISSFIKEVA